MHLFYYITCTLTSVNLLLCIQVHGGTQAENLALQNVQVIMLYVRTVCNSVESFY